MNQNKKVVLLFVALAVIWGASFIGIEIVVHEAPAWLCAAVRTGIAAIVLYFYCRIKKIPIRLPEKSAVKVWLIGLLTIGIPFSFLFWSEQRVSGGLGGIINGTVPIWTSLVLVFARPREAHKTLSFPVICGIVLGFLGLWCIFYPKLSIPSGREEILGGLGLLGMAISYAISNTLNRKMIAETKNLHSESVVFHQHVASSIYLFIMSGFFETWPSSELFFQPKIVATILFLALIPSAVAYLIYFYLLKTIGTVKTAAVTYLIPIAALGFDFLIQGRRPDLASLVGVSMILLALSFIRSAKVA